MSSCSIPDRPGQAHTFKAENGHFTLDGKPFQVISGEMHYARIPRAYWRDRMRMAKAMGLNTITTYVFWNEHEPRPGVYDFYRQQRRRRIHPRSPAGRPLRHSAPWPLRLRRMGIRRLSRLAAQRSQHCRALQRSEIYRAGKAMVHASGKGIVIATNWQWRPHHSRPG